jgi:hypothetical protein
MDESENGWHQMQELDILYPMQSTASHSVNKYVRYVWLNTQIRDDAYARYSVLRFAGLFIDGLKKSLIQISRARLSLSDAINRVSIRW